jgi:hypothetical protein
MADEDFKLNNLSRFSKSSKRLLLREYSNCEVPAGCGGVVFRWKEPDQIIAFEIKIFISGEFEIFIDGKTPESAISLFKKGEHVLSLVISNFDSKFGMLMFVGKMGETGHSRGLFHEGNRKTRVLSLPDSSWNYVLSPPLEDSWSDLNFDDTNWKSMISKDLSPIPEEDSQNYLIDNLSSLGAQSLGIEEVAEKTIWIRKRFSISESRMEE